MNLEKSERWEDNKVEYSGKTTKWIERGLEPRVLVGKVVTGETGVVENVRKVEGGKIRSWTR